MMAVPASKCVSGIDLPPAAVVTAATPPAGTPRTNLARDNVVSTVAAVGEKGTVTN